MKKCPNCNAPLIAVADLSLVGNWRASGKQFCHREGELFCFGPRPRKDKQKTR